MLTKTTIDTAPVRSTPYVLWDDELAGFGCKVHPTGRRTFMVQYRLRGSRCSHKSVIGTYGVVTVVQARKQARDMLAEAGLGKDPQATAKQRTIEAQAVSITGLVTDYLAALQAGTASVRRRAASDGYLADTVLQLGRLSDRFGSRPAGTLARRDVTELLMPYIGQPSVHRRLHGAVHRLYAWGRQHELVSNRPTEDISTTTPAPRERTLSLEELARLWRAAEAVGGVHGDAIKLLITTGQRRNEVSGMTWGELDLSKGLWTLLSSRTKARRQHVIPLPSLALEVLTPLHGRYRSTPAAVDLVLPTLSSAGRRLVPITGWNWLKRELDRYAEVGGWQLHDLRRSLVTVCAEHGADVAVLDSMLNHASSATRGGVIGTYQRATLLQPMREVMRLWDQLLRSALGRPAPDNVIPLRRA